MISYFAGDWLQNARIGVQCVWFASIGAALFLTIWALYRAKYDAVTRAARGLWAFAMAMLILMWLGGATLEMLRRAALVSGVQMVIALGAFSLLAAGTLSLAREWFGENFNAPLRTDKIALSLVVLTLAGWWFGGLALQQNSLWHLTARFAALQNRTPDGWALLLGGATLLGASRSVRSRDETFLRVANPRIATWWLAATALFLSLPFFADNVAAESVFTLSAAVFGSKVWRVRADCPRFLKTTALVRLILAITLFSPALWMLFSDQNARRFRSQNLSLAWHEPTQIVAWALVCGALLILSIPLREMLRLTIFDRFFDRALLQGALIGFVLATLIFGPGGAIFWAFWPLCGLFFDLLAPREFQRDPIRAASVAAELPAEPVASFEPAP